MSETKVTLGNCEHRNPGMRGGSACGIDRWPCPHWNRVEVCTLPPGCPYRPAPAPKTRLVRVKVRESGRSLEYAYPGHPDMWACLALVQADTRFRGYLWPDGARRLASPWRPVNPAVMDGQIEHATEVEFEVDNG